MKCSICGETVKISEKIKKEMKRDGWEDIACCSCWEEILDVEPISKRVTYINMIYDFDEDGVAIPVTSSATHTIHSKKWAADPDRIHAHHFPRGLKDALGISGFSKYYI